MYDEEENEEDSFIERKRSFLRAHRRTGRIRENFPGTGSKKMEENVRQSVTLRSRWWNREKKSDGINK